MFLAKQSNPTTLLSEPTIDPIHLVTQFYLPKDPLRLQEVQEALRRNAVNPHIDTITLLNERFYTIDELGVDSYKIKQTLVPSRVKFSELFAPRQRGYTVVANADIFTDASIASIRWSDLHCAKKVYSLLRYEYTTPNLKECPLFGPRSDSADTWIFHSNHRFPLHIFHFEMGRPGCDNKLNYLFDLLGFEVYNDPKRVRTYHCHKEAERNYTLDSVPPPYMMTTPCGGGTIFGQNVADIREVLQRYDLQEGNRRLAEYIQQQTRNYVVPRIAGVENNAAAHFHCSKEIVPLPALAVLKNNAGIDIAAPRDVATFTEWYLKAFQQCDMYASWEPWGHYYKHIETSQPYIERKFNKRQLSTGVFDVFHFVASGNPWTHALRGKRLLIVSPFVDLIQQQGQVYPIDLFPECTFVYLKPPMTQADEANRGFTKEFHDFCAAVRTMEFDVALCSCGGYGNPICAFIYTLGKSAIYVGGVLQMYFGIYGTRWLKERKDVLNLYMTPEWKRPLVKPKGFEKVEKGCYW
jgi:hypothetical protein